MQRRDFLMRVVLSGLFSFYAVAVFSQETPDSVFGKIFETNDAVLTEYPEIAKAHEKWKADMAKALETYHGKLSTLLHREHSKGDLEFLKGLEKVVNESKSHHAGPSIVTDRLPPKVAPIQTELNKTKSRANKALIAVLDKEIAAALKDKQLQKAKAIDEFFNTLFLPEIMQAKFSEAARLENKVYLFVPERKSWSDAYQWCRERHGDLASINSAAEQAHLYKMITKLGRKSYSWTGGHLLNGRWYWTDGTPFRFTYWAPREPSGRGQNRIAFGFGENGRWDDGTASTAHSFIVQWTLY